MDQLRGSAPRPGLRHSAGHPPSMGQGDLHRRTQLRRTRRRVPGQAHLRGARGLAHDLDVVRVPDLERERLDHCLLGAEARRKVHRGVVSARRVRPLAVGEQPQREAGAPLQRLLHALDLEQVDPHGHAAMLLLALRRARALRYARAILAVSR